MDGEKSRTAEEIFQDMHRELRSWNADIPESPDRMDPILRIMLRLYASQLASIDGKITDTWTHASNALIRSMYPESMRWPVPAFTVIQAEPSDPVIHVDPRSRFFYKEERDGGKTFFFSTLRTEKLLSAKLKNLYYMAGDAMRDISPASRGRDTSGGPDEIRRGRRRRGGAVPGHRARRIGGGFRERGSVRAGRRRGSEAAQVVAVAAVRRRPVLRGRRFLSGSFRHPGRYFHGRREDAGLGRPQKKQRRFQASREQLCDRSARVSSLHGGAETRTARS